MLPVSKRTERTHTKHNTQRKGQVASHAAHKETQQKFVSAGRETVSGDREVNHVLRLVLHFCLQFALRVVFLWNTIHRCKVAGGTWRGVGVSWHITISTADKVVTTDASGVVRQFYWNGTQWRRFGSSLNQSNVSVPTGSSVGVVRTGDGPAQLLNVALPYTL